MYIVEKKVGDEYVMKKAKCNRCFSDEIVYVNDVYICTHCRKEFKNEQELL